jgi:membrane-associated phospholipid phosphatase
VLTSIRKQEAITLDGMILPARPLARLLAIASIAMVPAAPASAWAQQTVGDPAPPQHVEIFSSRDAMTAAVFVVGVAAIMPFDRHIAVESQRSSLQNNGTLNHTMTALRVLGQPGSIAIAAATYIYGRAGNSPRSAELGLRTIESIGAAGVTTLLIKGFVGRARPYAVSDTNPHDYEFGRGFQKDAYTSFPSGHVTTAFAAASAASQEISYLWPHASHLWTPLLFTSASLVGVARIYEDKHWASDVIAGAAVGTLVSRVVVHYSRAHPRNAIDRLLLPAGISAAGGSRDVGFTWNYRF